MAHAQRTRPDRRGTPGVPGHRGFFEVLGARPALGRPILPEDDDPAAPPVAVIGNGYWRRHFSGTPAALGATVTFGDVTYAIVGAMPSGFSPSFS